MTQGPLRVIDPDQSDSLMTQGRFIEIDRGTSDRGKKSRVWEAGACSGVMGSGSKPYVMIHGPLRVMGPDQSEYVMTQGLEVVHGTSDRGQN